MCQSSLQFRVPVHQAGIFHGHGVLDELYLGEESLRLLEFLFQLEVLFIQIAVLKQCLRILLDIFWMLNSHS